MVESNFGHLGVSFQQSLIKSIIEDKVFGITIIDVIESKYFDNNSFKYIIENLKELYAKYEKIPDYIQLEQKINSENKKGELSKIHLDTLTGIKENDQQHESVQDTALNFCRQQNLKKELKKVNSIIENGAFEEYHTIEKIIQDALQVGLRDDDVLDVFFDIEGALLSNVRTPIPTGVNGLDVELKGGLSNGEFGLVIAPTGTGKTTLLTKFGNTAFNENYHVLQIFFEDNPGVIKQKHFTCWSEIDPDEQRDRIDEMIPLIENAKSKSTGSLGLVKLPSGLTTISQIKNRIRKHLSGGGKLDLLLIDYIECIAGEKNSSGDEWKGEGAVMRALESMAVEFNIAIWAATQGSRDSISSELVTTDQMGGSIKKAQIAHVVMSIAKTLEQKEHNLATMALLKSRVGSDGIIWTNCEFNNKMLKINTDSQNTLLGHEEDKVMNKARRAAEVFKSRNSMLNVQ